jgi:hypothetical protein
MSRSEAKKREADREQFQKGFPGCRFRGATVIADDSPVEEAVRSELVSPC